MKSVIVASVCLDNNLMRIAHDVRLCSRSSKDYIDSEILTDLTTSILAQYYAVNEKLPLRMLIYREGVNEGSCDNIIGFEIKAIREGCRNFKMKVLEENISCSCSAGCNLCCPLITFVACLMNSNIKIVPANPERDGARGRANGPANVPSGVCVDDHIVDAPTTSVTGDIPTEAQMRLNNPNRVTLLIDNDPGGYDFILVAHGSGLGTSKPVHYRVLLNENAVLMAGYGTNSTRLSRDVLENLTYHMSFLYSTASKAIRLVPVVYYGARLAKITLKILPYLLRDDSITRELIDSDDIIRDEVDQNDENRSQRRRRFNSSRDNTSSSRFIYKHTEVSF